METHRRITIVWETEALGKTPRNAVDDFARKGFDKPRHVIWKEGNQFYFEDGVFSYEVVFIGNIDNNYARYQIWQLTNLRRI